MTKLKDLHGKWSMDPAYKAAYDDLEEEFALAEANADARSRAGLTQAEVAERMHTTQSNIARLEAGRTTPSTRTLEKFAQAIGAKLKIWVGTPGLCPGGYRPGSDIRHPPGV